MTRAGSKEVRGMNEKLNPVLDNPVFVCLVIDASGSMERYQQDVIAGHKDILAILRETQKCDLGVLYVCQILFASQPRVLNGFSVLERSGVDQIVALDKRNYVPSGTSALYDAILQMAQNIEEFFPKIVRLGYMPTASIVVITDGVDGSSKATVAEIRAAIQRLRTQKWIIRSLLVGLASQQFNHDRLEDLRIAIDFSQRIILDRTPQNIRMAFRLCAHVDQSIPDCAF